MSMWTQRHTTASTLSSSRSIGSASSTRYSTLPSPRPFPKRRVTSTISDAKSVDFTQPESPIRSATRKPRLPGPAAISRTVVPGLWVDPPNDPFVDRSSDVGHPLVPVLPARCHLSPGLTALLAVSIGVKCRAVPPIRRFALADAAGFVLTANVSNRRSGSRIISGGRLKPPG